MEGNQKLVRLLFTLGVREDIGEDFREDVFSIESGPRSAPRRASFTTPASTGTVKTAGTGLRDPSWLSNRYVETYSRNLEHLDTTYSCPYLIADAGWMYVNQGYWYKDDTLVVRCIQ